VLSQKDSKSHYQPYPNDTDNFMTKSAKKMSIPVAYAKPLFANYRFSKTLGNRTNGIIIKHCLAAVSRLFFFYLAKLSVQKFKNHRRPFRKY
jgi:hypothetical protein